MTYNAVTHRATIEPAARLESNTAYRVVVGGGIEDLVGNLIAQDSWGFTTGDTIDPELVGTHPGDDATGVARGVTITLTLDSKVTGVSGETIRLRNEKTGDRVAAKVTWDRTTMTISIDPTHRLAGLRWYRVRVLHGVEDLAGNNLAEGSFTFKTRA